MFPGSSSSQQGRAVGRGVGFMGATGVVEGAWAVEGSEPETAEGNPGHGSGAGLIDIGGERLRQHSPTALRSVLRATSATAR